MKKLLQLLAVSGSMVILTESVTWGQFTNTIRFDENGHGFYNGVAILGGLVAADPSGGVAGPVLLYNLPGPAVTIGDVLLSETGLNPTNASDIVRFWNNNQVIFYSERDVSGSGDNDLADISGLPTFTLANSVLLTETGSEGNNGANYHALPGQPGWDGGSAGTFYSFISDVPEPNTAALIGAGLGTLLLLRRRR